VGPYAESVGPGAFVFWAGATSPNPTISVAAPSERQGNCGYRGFSNAQLRRLPKVSSQMTTLSGGWTDRLDDGAIGSRR
jgi:hypothetical protein